MIKLESSKMQTAILRAKAQKLHARKIGERTYAVLSGGVRTYTVKFAVPKPGMLLAECDCPNANRTVCKHIAAAAALNIAIHSNYSKPSDTPEAATHKLAGLLVKRQPAGMRLDGIDV